MGGRFSVISVAVVPLIRRGSALVRGILPGNNLVCRVRGVFRVGNFYPAKNFFWRIPRRRQSDPPGPTRTQADSIGVRRGIVPQPRLPSNAICSKQMFRRVKELGRDNNVQQNSTSLHPPPTPSPSNSSPATSPPQNTHRPATSSPQNTRSPPQNTHRPATSPPQNTHRPATSSPQNTRSPPQSTHCPATSSPQNTHRPATPDSLCAENFLLETSDVASDLPSDVSLLSRTDESDASSSSNTKV